MGAAAAAGAAAAGVGAAATAVATSSFSPSMSPTHSHNTQQRLPGSVEAADTETEAREHAGGGECTVRDSERSSKRGERGEVESAGAMPRIDLLFPL